MMKIRLARPSARTVLGGLAIVMVTGGVAVASGTIPGADGEIDGCYDRNGSLRVVPDGASCRSAETALTWNQKGVQGDPGTHAGQTCPSGQFVTGFDNTGAIVCAAPSTTGGGDTGGGGDDTGGEIPVLTDLTLMPDTIAVGEHSTGTVTLASPSDVDISVSLQSSSTASVPATVTIPAGETQGEFTVTGLESGSAAITATLNGTSITRTLTIR